MACNISCGNYDFQTASGASGTKGTGGKVDIVSGAGEASSGAASIKTGNSFKSGAVILSSSTASRDESGSVSILSETATAATSRGVTVQVGASRSGAGSKLMLSGAAETVMQAHGNAIVCTTTNNEGTGPVFCPPVARL